MQKVPLVNCGTFLCETLSKTPSGSSGLQHLSDQSKRITNDCNEQLTTNDELLTLLRLDQQIRVISFLPCDLHHVVVFRLFELRRAA